MNTEIAWAAGFFDGEGCIRFDARTSENRNPRLELIINQNDSDPLYRFADVAGVGNVTGPIKGMKTSSPYYRWYISRYVDVLSVCQSMWPYLSSPKRTQILNAFDEYDRVMQR